MAGVDVVAAQCAACGLLRAVMAHGRLFPLRHARILAGLLALLALGSAHADDEWLGGDKRAHFFGGLIVGGITSEHTGSRGPGVLLGCGVGVFGELIEAARYGWVGPRASVKDFGAECLGGVLGAYIGTNMAPSERV